MKENSKLVGKIQADIRSTIRDGGEVKDLLAFIFDKNGDASEHDLVDSFHKILLDSSFAVFETAENEAQLDTKTSSFTYNPTSIKSLRGQHQVHGTLGGARLPGLPQPSPSGAPTLGGRLMPVRKSANEFDLFWKDRAGGKPTFRYRADQNQLLILAQPNPENIAALFDAAEEAGIGFPKVEITGTPEFQRLAAQEAARRGLPVDTSKLCPEAREIYRQTFSEHHGQAANSITSGAYESQHVEEQRRIAELAAARAKNDQGGDDDGDRRPGGPRG